MPRIASGGIPRPPALPEGTVYGLTEGHQAEIRRARLVSNPGCYPTAALLALEPLHRAGLLTGPVIVDAKSGVSGAGKTPSERTHFSENHGSVAAYAVFQHRHTAEIEQELGASVTFVPHLVPLDRGILETIYGTLKPGTTEQQVADALTTAYADAPFVRLTGGALPEIKHVAHTNFCDIGWKVDAGAQPHRAGGRSSTTCSRERRVLRCRTSTSCWDSTNGRDCCEADPCMHASTAARRERNRRRWS